MDFLIIDTSCLYMTYAYLPHKIGMDNGLCGSMIFLKTMLKNFPKTKLILVLDGSIDASRELNEDYKVGRADKSGLYKNFSDFIVLAERLPNVEAIIISQSNEADHVIALTALKYSEKGKVCIYSKDKDFWQLVGMTNIEVSNKYIGKGKGFQYVTKETIMEKFGVEPDRLVFFRMIKGDPSDNLKPPIPRLPSKKIIPFVESVDLSCIDMYDGLTRSYLIKLIDNIEDEKLRGKFREAINDILVNFRIMDLYYGVRNNKDLINSVRKVHVECSKENYNILEAKYR